MTEAMETTAAHRTAARITGWGVLAGLLWRQWLAGRWLVLWALGAWLAGLWALELFFHPGFILAFGLIYALLAGPLIGGAEVTEGSEEFAFSLPPTRGMRYLANLVAAAAPLLALTVVGALAVAHNWPQAIWGLAVESGFTEPFPAVEETFLYPLAVALPFAVLALSFVIAALAGSRGIVAVAWMLGLIAAGAVLGAGFLLERILWGRLTGILSVAALFVLGAGVLEAGYLLYLRKEGVSRPAPMGGSRPWWVWVIVTGAICALLFLGLLWGVRVAVPRAELPVPAKQAGQGNPGFLDSARARQTPQAAPTNRRPATASSQPAQSASAPAAEKEE